MIATVRAQWRGFQAATWLGFLINSNWINPVIFAIYSVLRPLSAAFILVVMYRVISGNAPGTAAYLAFLVTGAAFWSFVQYGFAGLSNGIVEDRGEYRMLKYVYISSLNFYVYLFGRALAQLGSAVASTLVVLIVAGIALGLPITPFAINYPLLIAGSAIALVAVVAIAMAFGLLMLRMVDAHGYGELGAAFLYVISGAIFPITVLPAVLSTIASLLPLAYWMEVVRRSLLGAHAIRMFPGLTDGEVVLRLLATSVATVLIAFIVFGWADRSARGHGLIDRESNW